jgi:plastocyanin
MRLGFLATAAIVLSTASCGGDAAPTDTNGFTGATGATGNTGSTGGSTSSNITVTDGSFTPSATTVSVNTTVTWSFAGTTAHNVTFDNGSVGNSGDKSNGEQFQKQFTAAGTYTYQCSLHYGMTGAVTVQ